MGRRRLSGTCLSLCFQLAETECAGARGARFCFTSTKTVNQRKKEYGQTEIFYFHCPVCLLWPKPHYIYNAHQNISTIVPRFTTAWLSDQKTDLRIKEWAGNDACPSQNLARALIVCSFTRLVGQTRQEPYSAMKSLGFSSVFVILTEMSRD